MTFGVSVQQVLGDNTACGSDRHALRDQTVIAKPRLSDPAKSTCYSPDKVVDAFEAFDALESSIRKSTATCSPNADDFRQHASHARQGLTRLGHTYHTFEKKLGIGVRDT